MPTVISFLFKSEYSSLLSGPPDLHSQTKILRKGEKLLVQEEEDKSVERENTLKENAPPLKLSGLSVEKLQVPGWDRNQEQRPQSILEYLTTKSSIEGSI